MQSGHRNQIIPTGVLDVKGVRQQISAITGQLPLLCGLLWLCIFSAGQALAAPYVVPGEYIVEYRRSAGAELRPRVHAGAALHTLKKISVGAGAQMRVVRLATGSVAAGTAAAKNRWLSAARRFVLYDAALNACPEITAADADIITCVPNFRVRAYTLPDDPLFEFCDSTGCRCPADPDDHQTARSCQWGLQNSLDTDIDAPEAWEITTGSASSVIAVIDTGIDYTHADLAANIWTNPGEIPGNGFDDDGNCYVDDVHGINADSSSTTISTLCPAECAACLSAGDPRDDNGHGTHVAGIIAARGNNSAAISGVNWIAQLMAVKFLDAGGDGTLAAAIEATNYVSTMARNHGVPVAAINNSWGGQVPADELGELPATIQSALDAGIVVVSAAGNQGSGRDIDITPEYPASLNLPGMINVAAANLAGEIAGFSNYGRNSVHVAAPGEDILSLKPVGVSFPSDRFNSNDTTSAASGTSMATPVVTGIVALVRAAYPGLTQLEIVDSILNQVTPLASERDRDRLITGGSVNAFLALTGDKLSDPTPTVTPTASATPEISPTPTATPTPTPGIVTESSDQYTLRVRGKLRRSRKSGIRFKDGRVVTRTPFRIAGAAVNRRRSSETLTLRFSFEGLPCANRVTTITTDTNATFRKFFKLRRIPRGINRMRVELLDDSAKVRGVALARVRGRRLELLDHQLNDLSVEQITRLTCSRMRVYNPLSQR